MISWPRDKDRGSGHDVAPGGGSGNPDRAAFDRASSGSSAARRGRRTGRAEGPPNRRRPTSRRGRTNRRGPPNRRRPTSRGGPTGRRGPSDRRGAQSGGGPRRRGGARG